MKKLMMAAAVVGLSVVSGFSQGAITFGNLSGDATTINAPVKFNNVNVNSGYSAQLFAGPLGTLAANLTAQGSPVAFNDGFFAGYLPDTSVTISGVAISAMGVVQLRAWNNASGTVTSWANATVRGESVAFTSAALSDPAFPSGTGSTPAIPSMTGLGTAVINLTAVPEPTTILLGLMGGAALLFRRKK